MKVVIFSFLLLLATVNSLSPSIPQHLIKCYRRNYTTSVVKPPLTIQLLIELIRKVELAEKNSFNLRMFSTALLHSLRFDGVKQTPNVKETEVSIPFSANGKQFYKYKLLVDYLTSGKPQLIPHDKLSTSEMCILHEIISNTVHVWKSGNEGRSCPELRSMSYKRDDQLKPHSVTLELIKCPLESGVVKTRWGTISPGHVIAGVASALQETHLDTQNLVNEIRKDNNSTSSTNLLVNLGKVSNVGVATVAGDLAEVTTYQHNKQPKIGPYGTWNSTYIPRLYHLQADQFEMTGAELLGGIDGLLFANNIKKWQAILTRTRLSQLFDMYYSKRGIAFDKSYRACDRRPKLPTVLSDDLHQQTSNIAKILLELGGANQYKSEEDIEKYSAQVVNTFKDEADQLTLKFSACEQDSDPLQPLEMISILDESWKGYKTEAFVGALTQAVDVSHFSSSLGLINGHTGLWMTNVTDSLVQLYDDLGAKNELWHMSFKLSKGLESINSYLQNRSKLNCVPNGRVPRNTILLIMANSASLTHEDFIASSNAIRSLKMLYPETRIFYITSIHNSEDYQKLAKEYLNDFVIKISEYNESIIARIVNGLQTIPSRIMDVYCSNSQVNLEDYVTPDKGKFYEIHNEYIKRYNFLVKFKGNNYGEAQVCAYDTTKPGNKLCYEIIESGEIQFNTKNYCTNSLFNCSVQFSVKVTRAKFQCSEIECRYPDQFRLGISTSWTSISTAATTSVANLVILVLVNICLSN